MDLTPGAALVTDFTHACNTFAYDFHNIAKITTFADTLNFAAQGLAQSQVIREQAGQINEIWPALQRLWRELARALLSVSNDDNTESALGVLIGSVAKFSRNLVAGVPSNQLKAFDYEPEVRNLLHYFTSWTAMNNSDFVATARLLTQTLSNTVTSNEPLVARLWETYLNLPEDQLVLTFCFYLSRLSLAYARRSRLLGSPDEKTILTVFVFILNCIHNNPGRLNLLTRTPSGIRVCIGTLDDMIRLHEADEGSDAAKAFDTGYTIFTQLIEGKLIPTLYDRFMIQGEIITPHQTTLLKLTDSYLQSTPLTAPGADIEAILDLHASLGEFLARLFTSLANYSIKAVRRALGTESVSPTASGNPPSPDGNSPTSSNPPTNDAKSSSSGLNELDVMLPKVCEALVLVAQCITTIALAAEDRQEQLAQPGSVSVPFASMKTYFAEIWMQGQGLVELLIELLRQLDEFLPRINFGKPVSERAVPAPSPADGAGFSYLKRDLVRMLGVLSHESRSVQDRVREAGGLPVVMNLCVIDERNPYLREHAIFTLSNLLKGNEENQKFVESIKPSQEWGEDGVLKKYVGATLK